MKISINYLVIGGLGFIGSHLCLFLASKNFKINIIDNFSNINLLLYKKIFLNKNIKVFRKNFNSCSQNYLKKICNKNTIVFHLAATGRVKNLNNLKILNTLKILRATTYNNNIFIVNFFKKISSLPIQKFIFASSSSVYGNDNSINKEIHALEPVNLYGLSKMIGEKLVKQYFDNFLIARIFNVYGMCKYSNKSNNLLLQNILEKKSFYIEGDGHQKRDFIYIDDVVDSLYLLSNIKNTKYKIFNIGTGKSMSIIEFVKIFRKNYFFRSSRKNDTYLTKASLNNYLIDTYCYNENLYNHPL